MDAAFFYRLLRPLLFRLEAETAHAMALRLLGLVARRPELAAWLRRRAAVADRRLETRAFGLTFPSPLGLAAGFDKGDGVAPALFALGFGFVEVGTLTPRPQPGNPRPRLFRLAEHRALINRMGFNNEGAEAARHLYAERAFRPGPLGFNLGKNKTTPPEEAAEDYRRALEAVLAVGDYFVVNVSSPNTPGLRDLQAPAALRRILRPLLASTGEAGKPLLLKLAPDLADQAVDELADLARDEGVAGLVLANTTVGRPGVAGHPNAPEAGGLSGPPLLPRAVELVARVHRRHGSALPLVAAGGISTAADAHHLLTAGATLLQLYTALVYAGPTLPGRILRGLGKRRRV